MIMNEAEYMQKERMESFKTLTVRDPVKINLPCL
jgi:hypothetical protein